MTRAMTIRIRTMLTCLLTCLLPAAAVAQPAATAAKPPAGVSHARSTMANIFCCNYGRIFDSQIVPCPRCSRCSRCGARCPGGESGPNFDHALDAGALAELAGLCCCSAYASSCA